MMIFCVWLHEIEINNYCADCGFFKDGKRSGFKIRDC